MRRFTRVSANCTRRIAPFDASLASSVRLKTVQLSGGHIRGHLAIFLRRIMMIRYQHVTVDGIKISYREAGAATSLGTSGDVTVVACRARFCR